MISKNRIMQYAKRRAKWEYLNETKNNPVNKSNIHQQSPSQNEALPAFIALSVIIGIIYLVFHIIKFVVMLVIENWIVVFIIISIISAYLFIKKQTRKRNKEWQEVLEVLNSYEILNEEDTKKRREEERKLTEDLEKIRNNGLKYIGSKGRTITETTTGL